MVTYATDIVHNRKTALRAAAPVQFLRQRISNSAANLSRAGVMAARVEALNEALHRMAALVYERDADGVLCNVDSQTYRLLIPAPWGRGGWQRWGLRNHEARVLGHILRARQGDQRRPPLFIYDARAWYANLFDYTTIDAAQWWLQKSPVTLAEWRAAVTAYGA